MKLLTLGRRRAATTRAAVGPVEAALAPAFTEGSWDVPTRFNFTRDVVEALATDPKRQAAVCVGRDGIIEPRTFLQLAEGAERWALLLREHGVRPGDRVCLLVGRCPDWLEVVLAAIKVGAVSVSCPETLPADAVDARLARADPRLVVAGDAAEDALAQAAARPPILRVEDVRGLAYAKPEPSPAHDTAARDLAFVLFTPGTAGEPKAVAHTHGAVFAARVPAEHWLDAGPRDLVWSTEETGAPSAVWNLLLGPWSRGAVSVLHDGPFDPLERLDLIRRLGVTILCQTPAEYRALAESGQLARYRPARLRRLVSSGDRLAPDLVAAFEEAWGLTIHDGYGQAETGIVAGHGPGAGLRSGSVGLPLPGFELAVIDEGGERLPPGIEGDLAIRGRPPSLFAGYWEAPEETKAAFRGDWYLTGDVAAADTDGYLWLLGRAHDVITSAGRRFGPAEIEEALAGHPAVAQAGVVGMRDLERGGQLVRALVVLRPQTEASDRLAAEIREHVRHVLPAHQVPRDIEFVDELPRTADGRLRRLELRERPLAGTMPVWPAVPPPTWTLEPESPPEPEPQHEPEPEPEQHEGFAAPEPGPAAATRSAGLEPLPSPEAPVLPAPAVAPEPPPEPASAADPDRASEPAPEPAPEPASAVEVEPAVQPDRASEAPPPPEAPVLPAPAVAPEAPPEPASAAEPDRASEPAPEPASAVEVEPAVEPDRASEPPPAPVLEAASAEPAPLASKAPTEPAADPEAVVEPEGPAPTAETGPPKAAASAPPRVPEPLPEYIVPPRETPAPVPEPERVPEPDLSAEPLPDYIVDPERSSGRQGRQPGDRLVSPETPPDPLAGLKRPSGVHLPTVTERPAPAANAAARAEREAPPAGRPRPDPGLASRPRRGRSASEPGDELEGTDWLQGLSMRLSAYSLAEDAQSPPAAAGDGDAPEGDEPGSE
ncbi:MAG TPA: AMP-binding protein [Gaiellaceae bacterium]|nr:AMP-binding protein [Gaiellaceae bacterium]